MIYTLQRWLNATNMTELRAQNFLQTLQRFVQKTFILNYNSRNIEAKTLDRLTKDIAVTEKTLQAICNYIILIVINYIDLYFNIIFV